MQVEETQTSTTNTPLKPTRASFIRGLPLSMPVDEVIERGREVGLDVQPSDVHAARYYMRQASAAEAASKPPTIAQQLMLGGTISAQRDQDETIGLTKIAGVRNGTPRAAVQDAKQEPKQDLKQDHKQDLKLENKRRPGRPPRAQVKELRGPVEISIDDVLKVAAPTSGKGRGGRRTPSISANLDMEEQLHNLVVRLGTQRAREIIDAIEELAVSAS